MSTALPGARPDSRFAPPHDADPRADLSKLKLDRGLAPMRVRRRRRWSCGRVLLLLAAAAGGLVRAAAQGRHRARRRRSSPRIPSQQFVVLNATGYVVAQRKAAISSKATGRLEWLGVTEGSRVKAGDMIARIDARDVVAQSESAVANVRAARAALEQARAEERDAQAQLQARARISWRRNSSRRPRWTPPGARRPRHGRRWPTRGPRIAAAEANARNAAVPVDYTVIRAPFDGVILSKSANVGDLVTPFSNAADSKGAVVSMADMSTLEVEADVVRVEPRQDQGRPAGGDRARRAAGHALSRPHQPHGADGRPRQGHGDDQGEVRRDRPAHPARDERQGELPRRRT